jgi:hypothetical protein
MDGATSQLVRGRAGNRCEYCLLPQSASALRFHVEHIVARQHGGGDGPANLALACPECNLRKGTNLTGIDPDSGVLTRLYNPRQDAWGEQFIMQGARVAGRTAMGRTTEWLLGMNSEERVRLRELLLHLGLYPG